MTALRQKTLSTSSLSAVSYSLRPCTMAKGKKTSIPHEQHLRLPSHPRFLDHAIPIVDTHTHLLSTYDMYIKHYPAQSDGGIFAFVREMYGDARGASWKHLTEAIVDVWCEGPVTKLWKDIADSALSEIDRKEKWNGIEYWFVMGVHPHQAEHYTDTVERDILAAMQHPRCVGWGEIGLDYKASKAPHAIQQSVLERQLRHAVRLGKPITIHTREAEEDTERILKAEVPKEHPMHIHCFTDSPELALRLIHHFPNLYIGITGVITYTTNLNTSNIIRALVTEPALSLRILLETDAPYMIPANLYRDLPDLPAGKRLPISHTGMIPWTAEYVAKVASDAAAGLEGRNDGEWTVERVMMVARENARMVYKI
ncbi:Metallo-dependent hydrolase [Ramaria rubella]|nr:Metallo-dependent hydrolase [Ramaria rubella]